MKLFRFYFISGGKELKSVIASSQESAYEKCKIQFPETYSLIEIRKGERFRL